MADDALAAITQAADGLLYPSESDAPFTPFKWEGDGEPTPEKLAALEKGRKRKAPPAEAKDVGEFFAELADADDAARFKRLEQALRKNLADLRVVRVGEVKVSIYVVGRDSSGAWVGLHTNSVET